MKRLFMLTAILLLFSATCLSAAFTPTKKIVLFYNFSDTILKAQNAEEDIIAGQKELEKELQNHYSKRFIVERIAPCPKGSTSPSDYKALVSPSQTPFIVKIELEGTGTQIDQYQNAYGAQATGLSPTVNVHLTETIVNDDGSKFFSIDYGAQQYGAGTFAIGRDIFVAQKDPRKNTKNAVRGCFRDACKLNESINKYADPGAYQREINRFSGNFKSIEEQDKKIIEATNEEINKFKDWCSLDPKRKMYADPLKNMTSLKQKAVYINMLKKMNVYITQ